MSWDGPVEKLLYLRAWQLLRAFGRRLDPDDTMLVLELKDVGGYDVEIDGDLEPPREVNIWISTDQWDHLHVLCKDEDGFNSQCVYQEVEDPVFPGYQGPVLDALKRYSVLDELARIKEPPPGEPARDD